MCTLAGTMPAEPADPNALVLRWRFLPRKLVRDVLRRRADAPVVLQAVGLDDLEQAGLFGLVLASRRWDRGRGVRFSTFAFPYVLNGIRREIVLRHSRRPPEAPLPAEPAAVPGDDRPFEDLYAALARLRAADRDLLEQRFGLGGRPPRTLASMGRERGRTREGVRKRVVRALRRLAAELAALR